MNTHAAAEPTRETDIDDVLFERVMLGKTFRSIEDGAVRLRLRISSSHAGISVRALLDDKAVDFGLTMFRTHEGVRDYGEGIVLVGGSQQHPHLVRRVLPAATSEAKLADVFIKAAFEVAGKLLAGTTEATAGTEDHASTLLYKSADFMLVAGENAAGVAWELVPFTSVGFAAAKAVGRCGVCACVNGSLVVADKPLRDLGGDARLGTVRRGLLQAIKSRAATAAAEPRPKSSNTFDDYVNAYKEHVRTSSDLVLARRGSAVLSWDKQEAEDRDHDRGLLPLSVTIGGRKVVAYDPKEDMEWPVPYIRFGGSSASDDMLRFEIAISDLVTKSRREVLNRGDELAGSVWPFDVDDLVQLATTVVAPMLDMIREPDEIATAAAVDFLPAVLRAIGHDGAKLVGLVVNGMTVLSASVLSGDETSESVAIRLTGADATTFASIAADRTISVSCYRGARMSSAKTKLSGSRISTIKAALEIDDVNGDAADVVTAAAEPPIYLREHVLEKLTTLKISGKHVKLRVTSHKPSMDDRNTVYVLGDVEFDEKADALFGTSFRNGFSISALQTGVVSIKLPHIYPDPQTPSSVPEQRTLMQNVFGFDNMRDAATHIAKELAKILKPWFDKLDALVDNNEAVQAVVGTTWPEVAGSEYKMTELKLVRRDASMQRLVLVFGFTLKPAALDRYLDENMNSRFGIESELHVHISDSETVGKIQVAAEAYPTYTGSVRKPLTSWRARSTSPAELKGVVVSMLRDYLYTLETALDSAH
jgi:hypothetical protein